MVPMPVPNTLLSEMLLSPGFRPLLPWDSLAHHCFVCSLYTVSVFSVEGFNPRPPCFGQIGGPPRGGWVGRLPPCRMLVFLASFLGMVGLISWCPINY